MNTTFTDWVQSHARKMAEGADTQERAATIIEEAMLDACLVILSVIGDAGQIKSQGFKD